MRPPTLLEPVPIPINWARAVPAPTAGVRALAMVLAIHAQTQPDGTLITVGLTQTDMAAEAGLAISSVRRHLRTLVDAGALTVIPGKRPSAGNRYQLIGGGDAA